MIDLLLRLYPAHWRTRYGDEFAAVLEERPLGPFDVADVVLGALDAHLHLRGLGAASEHRKGLAMSLRIGGYAAIVGGVLWLLVLAGNAVNNGGDSFWPWLGYAIVGATVFTLVALIGLSAFQARRHPVLTWTAFAIPALGAVIGLIGYAAIVMTGDSDAVLIGGVSPWMLGAIGVVTMVAGSSLFALATWRARSLSRAASGLLAVGAVLVVLALFGLGGSGGGGFQWSAAMIPVIAAIVSVLAVIVGQRRGLPRPTPCRGGGLLLPRAPIVPFVPERSTHEMRTRIDAWRWAPPCCSPSRPRPSRLTNTASPPLAATSSACPTRRRARTRATARWPPATSGCPTTWSAAASTAATTRCTGSFTSARARPRVRFR